MHWGKLRFRKSSSWLSYNADERDGASEISLSTPLTKSCQGDMNNSDLELAGGVFQHCCAADSYDLRERTVLSRTDNSADMCPVSYRSSLELLCLQRTNWPHTPLIGMSPTLRILSTTLSPTKIPGVTSTTRTWSSRKVFFNIVLRRIPMT